LLESDLRNEQFMNDVGHQAGLQHHHDGTPRLLFALRDSVARVRRDASFRNLRQRALGLLLPVAAC
ncbi:MAG TPA: hypothetical protein VHM72_07410, partial [Solirubrobacteraceae bacterium]|nr:hypothetical protein [Solirubrobacteraceae bacterium]